MEMSRKIRRLPLFSGFLRKKKHGVFKLLGFKAKLLEIVRRSETLEIAIIRHLAEEPSNSAILRINAIRANQNQ